MTDVEAVTVTTAHEEAEEELESALEEEELVVDEVVNPEEELKVLALDNAEEEVLIPLLELEPVIVPVVLVRVFATGVATRLPQTMFMETGREVA